jgi:hypothetical protein
VDMHALGGARCKLPQLNSNGEPHAVVEEAADPDCAGPILDRVGHSRVGVGPLDPAAVAGVPALRQGRVLSAGTPPVDAAMCISSSTR